MKPSRRDALALLGVSIAAACSRSHERAPRDYPALERPRRRVETNDVVLGAFASLRGPERFYGEALRRGLDVARAELAARGGVKGRRIEVLLRDDEGRADAAATAARLATVDERLVGLVGGTSRALAFAAAREVREATFIGACASRDDSARLGARGIGIAPGVRAQADALAAHVFGALGARSAAIVTHASHDAANATGAGGEGAEPARATADGANGAEERSLELDEAFARAAAGHGASIAVRERIVDADEVAGVLSRSRVDALLVCARGNELARIAARARRAAAALHVVCGLDLDARGAWTRELDGVRFATALAPSAPADFARIHRELFATEPDGLAALGRDALMLLAEALEASETTEYDAIAKAARAASFERASRETPSIAELASGTARFVAPARGA